MNKIIPSNVTIKLLKQKETIFKVARGKKEHYILDNIIYQTKTRITETLCCKPEKMEQHFLNTERKINNY